MAIALIISVCVNTVAIRTQCIVVQETLICIHTLRTPFILLQVKPNIACARIPAFKVYAKPVLTDSQLTLINIETICALVIGYRCDIITDATEAPLRVMTRAEFANWRISAFVNIQTFFPVFFWYLESFLTRTIDFICADFFTFRRWMYFAGFLCAKIYLGYWSCENKCINEWIIIT